VAATNAAFNTATGFVFAFMITADRNHESVPNPVCKTGSRRPNCVTTLYQLLSLIAAGLLAALQSSLLSRLHYSLTDLSYEAMWGASHAVLI